MTADEKFFELFYQVSRARLILGDAQTDALHGEPDAERMCEKMGEACLVLCEAMTAYDSKCQELAPGEKAMI